MRLAFWVSCSFEWSIKSRFQWIMLAAVTSFPIGWIWLTVDWSACPMFVSRIVCRLFCCLQPYSAKWQNEKPALWSICLRLQHTKRFTTGLSTAQARLVKCFGALTLSYSMQLSNCCLEGCCCKIKCCWIFRNLFVGWVRFCARNMLEPVFIFKPYAQWWWPLKCLDCVLRSWSQMPRLLLAKHWIQSDISTKLQVHFATNNYLTIQCSRLLLARDPDYLFFRNLSRLHLWHVCKK